MPVPLVLSAVVSESLPGRGRWSWWSLSCTGAGCLCVCGAGCGWQHMTEVDMKFLDMVAESPSIFHAGSAVRLSV